MKDHTMLMFISVSVGVILLVGACYEEIRAQPIDNNAIARYTQGLESKILCQDNPFRSHDIPSIVIPGNIPGKNGGIAIYGNANATENGKNGPISIGGEYSHKNGSYSSDLGGRGGNGGIAFCGSANGENITGG